MGAETNEPVTDPDRTPPTRSGLFGMGGLDFELNPDEPYAALRKAGLPETLEVAEMRLEYGVRDRNGTEWWPGTRKSAEDATEEEGGGALIVREHIILAAREVTP